jgi:hypothetical protein
METADRLVRIWLTNGNVSATAALISLAAAARNHDLATEDLDAAEQAWSRCCLHEGAGIEVDQGHGQRRWSLTISASGDVLP